MLTQLHYSCSSSVRAIYIHISVESKSVPPIVSDCKYQSHPPPGGEQVIRGRAARPRAGGVRPPRPRAPATPLLNHEVAGIDIERVPQPPCDPPQHLDPAVLMGLSTFVKQRLHRSPVRQLHRHDCSHHQRVGLSHQLVGSHPTRTPLSGHFDTSTAW